MAATYRKIFRGNFDTKLFAIPSTRAGANANATMRAGVCHSLRNRAKAWKGIHERSSQVAGLSVMKQLVLGLALAVALVVSSGCGGGSSGGSGLQPGTNGCTTFTDATAPSASRVINFGGSGNVYDPKCLAIATNQQVTFSGSFTIHPLRPGLAPSQSGGTPGSSNNPIQSISSGSSAQVVFGTAGTYPYYCSAHESQGMFGAIQVR